MMEQSGNGGDAGEGGDSIRRIVEYTADGAYRIVRIPLEGKVKDWLTIDIDFTKPRRDGLPSMFTEDGYLKPPLLRREPRSLLDKDGYMKPPPRIRPDNLRWWERLAWAWRGL